MGSLPADSNLCVGTCVLSATRLRASDDAPEPVSPADREAAARRRGGALAQAARPRRDGAPGRCRTVELAAGGLARAAEGDADRPRGAQPDRRAGDADAADQPGGDLAALGPLQDRRALQAL